MTDEKPMTMDDLIAKGPREVALFFGGSIQTPLHDFARFLEEMFPEASDFEIASAVTLAKDERSRTIRRMALGEMDNN